MLLLSSTPQHQKQSVVDIVHSCMSRSAKLVDILIPCLPAHLFSTHSHLLCNRSRIFSAFSDFLPPCHRAFSRDRGPPFPCHPPGAFFTQCHLCGIALTLNNLLSAPPPALPSLAHVRLRLHTTLTSHTTIKLLTPSPTKPLPRPLCRHAITGPSELLATPNPCMLLRPLAHNLSQVSALLPSFHLACRHTPGFIDSLPSNQLSFTPDLLAS